MKDILKDILDLCRLNLMEERVEKTDATDTETTLQAIDIARKRIVSTMEPSEVAEDAMERHIAENTADDGVYPWIDSPQYRADIATMNETHTTKGETMTSKGRIP